MAEPHTQATLRETARPAASGTSWPAATGAASGTTASGNCTGNGAATATGTGSSGVRLACYACKRRKVKCDRQLPICSLCHKLHVACEYPTHPEKPGPKTGSRHGSKRRRLNSSNEISSSTAEEAGFSHHAGAQPVSPASAASCDSPSHRGSLIPQDRDSPGPDGGLGRPHSSSGRQNRHAPIFSRIMYPSHEAQTRPQSPSTVHTSPGHQDGGPGISVQSVCNALRISRATYDMLMDAYFANMTSFSLFRPGSIEPKFAMMQYHSDAEALIAAIMSFSARHCSDCPSPAYFAQIASSRLDESVDRYGDLRPPFWLLQAGILVTFYQLTLSVRSKSWKKLGDCIRYAYDTNLHIVDANHDTNSSAAQNPPDIERWVLLEERRRAWWAVWEMDVFASTIRRLPTAIDGTQNLTLLPVPDSCWFNNVYQESCFLAEDCSLRWRHLAQSGNQSAKAWFIVVNSLMRNTQRLVYPAGSMSAMQSINAKHAESNQDELEIMANCLYCTVTSMPASLAYHGETLDFRPKSSPQDPTNPRQEHADIYSLHLMTQLCRFMIYHHKICARAPWQQQNQHQHQTQTHPNQPPRKEPSDAGGDAGPSARQASSEWSNYMNASDEIVSVVRSSARDHYRYVNPFLANTLWFAAAAQCACKVFGPASFNKRLTSSNLDLLKLTINGFITFWGGMESLKGKLARIESGLQSLMAGPGGNGNGQGNGREVIVGEGLEGGQQHRRDGGQSALHGRSEQDLHGGGRASMAGTDTTGVAVQNGTVPPATTEPLLVVPGTAPPSTAAPTGWVDPRWPSLVPELCDFTQPYPVAGQDLYVPDPIDFSPFGLEELLMAGVNFQL